MRLRDGENGERGFPIDSERAEVATAVERRSMEENATDLEDPVSERAAITAASEPWRPAGTAESPV